tara:strand:- start:1594 stop:3438 length:1845 start_codon:yes stop_codon:yes gene_type:complete
MIRLFIFIISFSSFIFSSNLSFEDIPIQEEGRVKPLDTFAKNQLLRIYGKRTLSDNDVSSTDWLFGVLAGDPKVLSIPVFYILNPEVIYALELDMTDGRKYTFKQISKAIELKIEMLEKIDEKSEDVRTLVEQQLLQIYFNAIHFKMLQSDFTCLTPIIPITNDIIAERLGVENGENVSFFKFARNLDKMRDFIVSVEQDPVSWSSADSSFFKNIQILQSLSTSSLSSNMLKIVPPVDSHHGGEWMSPWEIVSFGKLKTSYYNDLLISLEDYIDSRYKGNQSGMSKSIISYETTLYDMSSEVPSLSNLKRETWYNQANLFTSSIVFYIISFILVCFSLLFSPNILRKLSFLSVLIGLGYHFYGIILRMVIMGRPPVSTIYESIIFVGFISVLLALILEYFRKDGLGTLTAALSGIIFQYVSFGYASDGDTLGVLVAVLNSNFWLATHVTTITIGYGTSIVAGLMGHIYIFYLILFPKNRKKLLSIYNNTFGVTILALFFTLFGTILGGIWADQSWGRFWGWDPKENGALLICMWQIFMIHLRLTGIVKGLGFAVGMVINNIIVIMAWFGVNLLSIGLHSYGFVSGIAINLIIFSSIELIIGLGGYWVGKIRQSR